ncbi:MAG: Hsp33 family molecular chaperone HslO [Desulfobacterales bacterium]|nr:Hsp33 family molecular chaperone HslO [Desulfobacterales bacterium]
MIKKKPYGKNAKEQLKASARDKMYRFLLEGDTVRGVFVHGTRMINEMRGNFDLGILETYILGHAYLGATLMSASLKGQDRIAIAIEGTGPMKGLTVEANAYGEVRGFLKANPIPVKNPMETLSMSPFMGAGMLTVTKVLEGMKQPYTGQVALEYGNIAEDLANYCFTSEQTPTVFNLSINFDKEGNVVGAGGLFLQVMPGAPEETDKKLEELLASFPSPGDIAERAENPEAVIETVFKDLGPKIVGNHRVEFFCRCSKDAFTRHLAMLPKKDLNEIANEGPFPVELCCHNCNSFYHFSKEELTEILKNR